jgi:hypothetical protein
VSGGVSRAVDEGLQAERRPEALELPGVGGHLQEGLELEDVSEHQGRQIERHLRDQRVDLILIAVLSCVEGLL